VSKHAALLRGINVGKAKRVAMADLRRLMTDLGYADVKTLLNSGNIAFTVPAGMKGDPAARLERAMADELKITAQVLVLPAAKVAAAVKTNPFGKAAANPSRLMVTFLFGDTNRTKLEALAKEDWGVEALSLGPGVAYFWCPQGIIESPLFKAAGKILAKGCTTRNWATVSKLHELLR
jgi:uncharacterized protein (DUF1697 family)